jgi:hypothetical protein
MWYKRGSQSRLLNRLEALGNIALCAVYKDIHYSHLQTHTLGFVLRGEPKGRGRLLTHFKKSFQIPTAYGKINPWGQIMDEG